MALSCPSCGRRSPAGPRLCPHDGAALVPDARLGRPLGAYRLTSFLAQHPLGTLYALGGMAAEAMLVFEGESLDPNADFEAYVVELEKLQGSDVPEIARVLAAGEIQGMRFRIVPLTEGESLAALLEERDGPLPTPEGIAVIAAVARALAEAHARGVVHGGLCPEGVRIEGGRVQVEDFAVSRLRRWRTTQREGGQEAPSLLEYAAPEVDFRRPTAADDVFALGMVAWAVLAGHLPQREKPGSIGVAVPGLPPSIGGLVDALLADRGQRPTAATAVEVLAGRRSLLPRAAPPPPPPRVLPPPPPPSKQGRLTWALVVLALLAGIGAAAAVLLRPVPSELLGPAITAARPAAHHSWVVDPEKGPLRTIAAAVAIAAAGDRIIIPAGVHLGPVDIHLPLVIEAEPGAILQTADSNALRISADAEIRGLTIRRTGQRNRYTVRVWAGHAHFIGCTFQGAGGAVLAVTDNSRLTLERSTVIGGRAAAVFVTDHAQAQLIDCDLRKAGLSGLEVAGEGQAEVRRCLLQDNEAAGALAREKGQLRLDESTLRGNGNAAISLKDAASAHITGNLLEFGRASGMHLRSTGIVRVEDNRILGHPLAGIEISHGAHPVVRRNIIRDGLGAGIFVHEAARPSIEDNQIGGNALAGIEIATRGDPVVRMNSIENSRGGGFFIHDGGLGTLEGNVVSGSTRAGLAVRDPGSAPRVIDNTFRDGEHTGFSFLAGAEGLYQRNRITKNRLHGIEIHGAFPVLERNEISDNQGFGIVFFAGGGGTLEGNRLSGNLGGDFVLEGADPGRLVNKDTP